MKLNNTGAETNSQLIESYITILIIDCYLSSRNAKYLPLPASQILKCSAFLCYTVYIYYIILWSHCEVNISGTKRATWRHLLGLTEFVMRIQFCFSILYEHTLNSPIYEVHIAKNQYSLKQQSFMKVRMLSFCWNWFREVFIQLYDHFEGCSSWCCCIDRSL